VQDAGVAGYGVLQETKLAERLWPALQPALVLYVHCGNDFSDDWNFTHGSWGSLRSALPGRQFLQQHSAAWSLLKPGALALLSALSIRRGTLRIEGGEEATLVSELGARWAEGRDLTLAGLGALDEWCRAHGARLLVTSVGFRHEAGPDGPELLSRDALAVRDACSARGIPFLGPPAPRADRPASAWTNHSTIGHWTSDGHAWFAEFLFASLPD
jgi:hypothetical protein